MTTGGLVDIGIRELRDGLSRHLAEVRSGRTITITDHGRPIARIVPIDQPTALERLIAELSGNEVTEDGIISAMSSTPI